MTIVKKDGFNFMDGLNNDYIIVETVRLKEYIKYINDNHIQAIFIHDEYYSDKNIDFLRECPKINKINIISYYLENYDGLKHLKNLQLLMLDDPKGEVNVSKLTALKELRVSINENITGIEKCKNLKSLHMWKYKPDTKNLMELSQLSQLEELGITQSTITNLSGINNFKDLKKLELYYCSRLTSIGQIKDGSKALKEILIESCKKIDDFSEIKTMQNIEKIIYTDSGEIPSIKFIEEMPKLKSFVFMGTNVIDGNLNPCFALEHVAFTNKKHYSHKMKDFE